MTSHDDFCHLCGWWHSGLGRFEHPPLKDPTCDECYREPARTEPNVTRVLEPDEEAAALERFQPLP